MNLLNEAATQEIALWRQYPGYAAAKLLHNSLSPRADERYVMIPVQRVVANKLWHSRSGACVACRGFGKTRLAATLAILRAWLWPGRRVGCLSASFRQSKQIFEEIEKIYHRSPLLQQCTTRHPIISNDACKLDFKPVPGHDPSTIRALPLADGSKIRGARFHTIFVDEAVHVPEDVFNMVIRPMAATHQDPIKSMRIAEEKDQIWNNRNLTDEEKMEQIKELEHFIGANQIILLTSGYYSFNYVYKLYTIWADAMHGKFMEDDPNDIWDDGMADEDEDEDFMGYEEKEEPEHYAAFQVPYQAIPKGFLDKTGLKRARNEMTRLQFRMEYQAAWIIETGGWFKAEDVKNCRANNLGLFDHKILLKGSPGRQYLLTIDPARTSDAFAMVVSEFDPHFGIKIVYAEQFFGQDAHTGRMVDRIHELCREYNIIRIGMDKGGGGLQVADFLAEPRLDGSLPIYDMDNENYRGLKGNHILKIVDFNTVWIEGAHNKAYNLLQRRQVCFPVANIEGGGKDEDQQKFKEVLRTIERMISQILSIQPSETRTGRIHFDLPDKGGGYEKHKDLYSAWLIGCDIGYDMVQSYVMPVRRMPLLGIITPRGGYGMYL
jgi:hypothetical protein